MLCLTRMTAEKSEVTKLDDVWVLKIEKPNGNVQVYRCTTEDQAKQLAALLLPVPPALN